MAALKKTAAYEIETSFSYRKNIFINKIEYACMESIDFRFLLTSGLPSRHSTQVELSGRLPPNIYI
jgi:hypothetical protein